MRKLNTRDLFNAIKLVNKVGIQEVKDEVQRLRDKAEKDKAEGLALDTDKIGMDFIQFMMVCGERAENEVYAFIQNFLPADKNASELPVEDLIVLYKEFMEMNSKGDIADFFKKASDSITMPN